MLERSLEIIKHFKENVKDIEVKETGLRASVFKAKGDEEAALLRSDLQTFKRKVAKEIRRYKEELKELDECISEEKVMLQKDKEEIDADVEYLESISNTSCREFLESQIMISQLVRNESYVLLEKFEQCREDLSSLIQKLEILQSRVKGYEEHRRVKGGEEYLVKPKEENTPQAVVKSSVEEWTTCPQCGIPIKTKHLARHEKKVHGLIWTTGEIRSVQKCVRLSGQVSAENSVGKKCNIQKRSNIKKYNPKRKYVPSPKPMNNAEIEDLKRKNLEQMERIVKDRERMKRLRANGSGRLS